MQFEPLALQCLIHDLLMLVGAVVINNHMKVFMRVFSIEVFQKAQELRMDMRIYTPPLTSPWWTSKAASRQVVPCRVYA